MNKTKDELNKELIKAQVDEAKARTNLINQEAELVKVRKNLNKQEQIDERLNKPHLITTNVRWNDGYLEVFTCTEVRQGADLLWMRLADGQNRSIPLRQVRWFSTDPESHAVRKVRP